MATSTATVLINVITQTKGAVDGMDKMQGRMGKFQAGMRSAMVPAAAAGAVLIGFGVAAGKAASDLEQAFGGVDAVFGKNAEQVKRWAGSAANDLGLAKDEYANLAVVIGSQLKNMGVPLGQVASKTNDLVTKGADLAATFGGTTKEAVEALSATLRGETDPIERYGVSVKQTDINAALLAETTKKLAREQKAAGKPVESNAKLTAKAAEQIKKMSPAQLKAAKTAATLGLIEKQTADARGKFASEANTAAGQSQRAAANWKNAMADLGKILLPVMTKAANILSKVAVWMSKNQNVVITLAAAIGILVVAVLAVNAALWLMALNPTTLIIAGIVVAVLALAVGLAMLYKRSQTARKIMDAVWRGIKAGFSAVAKWFVQTVKSFLPVWRAVFAAVKGIVRAFIAYFKLVFNVIKGVIKLVVAVFKGDWRGALDAVKGIVRAFVEFFRSIFGAGGVLGGVVDFLKDKIKAGLGAAFDWLKTQAGKLGDLLAKPFDAAKDAIDNVVDAIGDLISWLGRIKIPDLGKLGGVISKVTGRAAPPPTSSLAAARGVGGYGAPRVAGVGVGARAASTGGGGVNITVNGALDPEAVARQIKRIVEGHDRRVGLRAS